MRRAPVVAGLATSILAVAGVGTAVAADYPITISFTSGTVKAGSLDPATAATSAAPASFSGTIDPTTFAATFPASGIVLPEAVLPSVDFGAPYGTGKLAVDATAQDFTGAPNATTLSLDLKGTISYKLVATVGSSTYSCTTQAPVPATFAGAPLNFATGAYGASGSQTSLALGPTNASLLNPIALATQTAFCVSLAGKVAPTTGFASTFAGTLTIPGAIPLPTVPAGTTTPPTTTPKPTTPKPTTTTTAPSGTTTSPALGVTISRPKAVARGRSTVVKVTVRNTGTGSAKSVRVKLATGSRVSPRSKTVSYATIGAGKRRTFSVRLRTTRKTTRSSEVRVTASGTGGLAASASTTLRLR